MAATDSKKAPIIRLMVNVFPLGRVRTESVSPGGGWCYGCTRHVRPDSRRLPGSARRRPRCWVYAVGDCNLIRTARREQDAVPRLCCCRTSDRIDTMTVFDELTIVLPAATSARHGKQPRLSWQSTAWRVHTAPPHFSGYAVAQRLLHFRGPAVHELEPANRRRGSGWRRSRKGPGSVPPGPRYVRGWILPLTSVENGGPARSLPMIALDELTTLFPPPAGTGDCSTGPASSAVCGAGLPADFKQMLATYGDVRFCNALRVFRPAQQHWLDLAQVTLAPRDSLADNEFGEPAQEVPVGASVDPATLSVGWFLRWRLSSLGRPRSRHRPVDAGIHRDRQGQLGFLPRNCHRVPSRLVVVASHRSRCAASMPSYPLAGCRSPRSMTPPSVPSLHASRPPWRTPAMREGSDDEVPPGDRSARI